jgi:hypothetical protein
MNLCKNSTPIGNGAHHQMWLVDIDPTRLRCLRVMV